MVSAVQVEGYQLSPQQRRLWPIARTEGAPNALVALSIDGELHVELLRGAIEKTVKTHEILRTVYAEHWETGSVIQIVSEPSFDWLAGELKDSFERVWQETRARRIDPRQMPQLRATLFKVTQRHHVLILATTILAADVRSLDLLAREIARWCNAPDADENHEPVLQYSQYAAWKNEGALARESWTEPDSEPFKIESVSSVFPVDAFKKDSRTLLLECWRALLRRWTGRTEIAVISSGRDYDELAELIGVVWETSAGEGEAAFYFNDPAAFASEGNVRFTRLRHESVPGRFKLMLYCQKDGFELQYDSKRFEREAIEEIVESYQLLLVQAVAKPDVPLNQLNVVGERARRRLLSYARSAEISDTSLRRIDELFAEQVKLHPNAPAVVFEGRRLTYAELDAASDSLAAHLISHGATTETPIGISLERSLELVIGIMAVLKSGAAYVPIDPGFPEARIKAILANCGASLLITDTSSQTAHGPLTKPHCANSLAYIIYTSGSTGEPKGVAIEHRHVTHYVRALIDRHPLLAGCNFASVSTIAADLGNTAIYTALLTGGCLHLISRERATDARQFVDYLATHDVDAIKIVPSHFHALSDSVNLKSVLPKRCLVFGGETLPGLLVERIKSVAPNLEIINHYGPTETTIGTTTHTVKAIAEHSTPIGRPLPGTQAYLLDHGLQLVPPGAPGELFIGGAGVGRGYCGRADLTSASFIPDPFSTRPGQRLYRTGDVARLNSNGELIFEGRRDRQVKLAGFRVELAEVEAALKQHSAVRAAVAVVESDREQSPLLVAYVTGDCSGRELREFLTARVPAHLIPASIHKVDRMPLTANGKLDRAALQTLKTRYTGGISEPQDPVSRKIHQICVDLIDHADLGADDNLLDLGVSSLKAMQLLARMRAAFEIALPLSAIFERPTINGLAELVQQRQCEEIAQLSDEEVRQRILAYQAE